MKVFKHFKFFGIAALFSIHAMALEFNVSYGKQQNQDFSIITLKSPTSFGCKVMQQDAARYSYVQCDIDKIPENGFLPFETEFFKISYDMQNKHFILSIHPKQKLKLFSIPDYLQSAQIFTDASFHRSKIWQVVGYKDQIPFLSPQKKNNGINFPIAFGKKLDMVGEMDVDKNPLQPIAGTDYQDYLRVKNLIKQQNYKTALSEIAQIFKTSPDTFFAKDLLFYQIIALYNLGLYDNVTENASVWIKHYASDMRAPETLYIMADAYNRNRFYTESKHFYQRIMEEYSQDRFAPLAKMQLAKAFMKESNMSMASIYFSQAYEEAKDLDSVSEIALEWAFYKIQNQQPEEAKDLIAKIVKKNPSYFTLHPQVTRRAINYLSSKKLYASAASIGQYYYDHTDEYDPLHEPIGFVLGDLYAKAGDFDSAHKSNEAFIKKYENLPRAKQVQEKDDKLLFSVSGDDATKLARYDYILKKYPNTEQSQKAARLKGALLLRLKHYPEIIAMRDLMGNSAEARKILDSALVGAINEDISHQECDQSNIYLVELKDFSGLKEPNEAFNCLYQGRLYEASMDLVKFYLKTPDDPHYLLWLYNQARVLNALDRYADSTLAIRDVLKLSKARRTKAYDDILFTLFDNLIHTDIHGATQLYAQLESQFKRDSRLMPVYAGLLQNTKPNPATRAIYAKNLMDLQNTYKNSDYTPLADFNLIEAYMDLNQKPQALEVAANLIQKPLQPEDLQQAFYLKASLEIALKQDASQSIQSCLAIQKNTSWKTLCEQSQSLIPASQDKGQQ